MRHERDFMENGDRYHFDFGECTASNGYAQVDTPQDASYFGIWTNPFDFITVSYIEGDIVRDIAENAEEYITFLRKLHAAYEQMETPIRGIDPMLNDGLCKRFVELGLMDLLHESCRPTETMLFLDCAFKKAYNESLYDEGYAWLLEDARKLSIDEMVEKLTDANFHSARDIFLSLARQEASDEV